jgi:multiple sugar transport system permease protein
MFLFIAAAHRLDRGASRSTVEHPAVLVTAESCQPFGGCTTQTSWTRPPPRRCREAEPLGASTAWAPTSTAATSPWPEVGAILRSSHGIGEALARIYDLPLYRALWPFTPHLLPPGDAARHGLGLRVNRARGQRRALAHSSKGRMIFFSLIPMTITPLVGR